MYDWEIDDVAAADELTLARHGETSAAEPDAPIKVFFDEPVAQLEVPIEPEPDEDYSSEGPKVVALIADMRSRHRAGLVGQRQRERPRLLRHPGPRRAPRRRATRRSSSRRGPPAGNDREPEPPPPAPGEGSA